MDSTTSEEHRAIKDLSSRFFRERLIPLDRRS